MNHNKSLVTSNVFKALLFFSVPVFFARMLQVLYSSTGLLILGNFSTTAEASGASTASLIMLLVTLTLFGLTNGLMVVIGQYCGAKSEEDAAGAIGASVAFFAVFTVVVTVLLLFIADPLIKLLNTPPEAIIHAKNYLRISSMGVVFIVGYNVVGSICRGLGNSVAPLFFVAVAFVVNIGLGLLFIPVLHMGATGSALALVIAQGVSFFFALIYLRKTGLGFKFSRRYIRFNFTYIKKLVKLGAPLSLQEILVMLSFMFITSVINKKGITESAAVGFVEQLVTFLMMPTTSIASAVSAISAHNFGANEPSRAKKCMWYGFLMSLAISVVLVVFCWFKGDLLVWLFSKDKAVIEQGFLYLKSYGLDCLFISYIFIMNGYFTSCNHSIFSMIHSIASTILLRIPVTAFLSTKPWATMFHLGLAAPLCSVGSVILCIIFYRHLSKKQERLSLSIS